MVYPAHMGTEQANTRDRLITSAARLFRQKGYHGTGLAEILAESHAPKGSLYHHFPAGKSDLALVAADWVSQGMLEIIDASFADAADFAEGAATFCHKLAKLFDLNDSWQSCPISTILFDGPDNGAFRTHANTILTNWIKRTSLHARELGLEKADADAAAELLLITIQGAWTLARARASSEVIRRIPRHLYG